VTAHAADGVANANPSRVEAGSSSTAHGDLISPNAAIAAMKQAEFIAIRIVMNSRWPRKMSPGRSIVARAAT
jgi:hypothetical protein